MARLNPSGSLAPKLRNGDTPLQTHLAAPPCPLGAVCLHQGDEHITGTGLSIKGRLLGSGEFWFQGRLTSSWCVCLSLALRSQVGFIPRPLFPCEDLPAPGPILPAVQLQWSQKDPTKDRHRSGHSHMFHKPATVAAWPGLGQMPTLGKRIKINPTKPTWAGHAKGGSPEALQRNLGCQ